MLSHESAPAQAGKHIPFCDISQKTKNDRGSKAISMLSHESAPAQAGKHIPFCDTSPKTKKR